MTTIADVFRIGFTSCISQFGVQTHVALQAARAIMSCRTDVLGRHEYRCDACGEEKILFNSCRNRNCPQCQTVKRIEWVHARIDELLPVGYFHVVFTVPQELAAFALRNQKVFYGLLFRAVNETLQELGADSKYLGAVIGFIAMLHTWGQNLMHHPHVHCIMPGGGLDPVTGIWKPSRDGFLFPIAVMRKLYRGKLMAYFKEAVEAEEIKLCGTLEEYKDQTAFKRLVNLLYEKTWVVYCKAPFASPQAVVKYLGQYTHRVAISNNRLLDIKESSAGTVVNFAYKDYADQNHRKVMTVSCVEFVRRFLMHVVPSGFVRIRHFGFMANRNRSTKLTAIRAFFHKSPPVVRKKGEKRAASKWREIIKELTGKDPSVCRKCHKGIMQIVNIIPRPSIYGAFFADAWRSQLILPLTASG